MNSKRVGDISEAMCLARFMELGWEVFIPFGDNSRCDMMIVRPGVEAYERVQVKTAQEKDGAIRAAACSSQVHRGGGKQHYRGQVEWLALVVQKSRDIYMVRPEDVATDKVVLRVGPTKNNQERGVRYAKDFCITRLIKD